MMIISYDIQDDKVRSRFNKYIRRFGHRLQFSVYEIDNSPNVLKNIMSDITNKFEKVFSQTDSVMIFEMSNTCKITRFGYAKNDESDMIIV